MLAVMAGTCLTLDAMANNQPLTEWMRRTSWEQAKWKMLIPFFCTTGHFVSSEDRVVHEDIPLSDFSRGGVVFIGASSLKWALKPWDLPAETQPLVHNFALGGTKHSSHLLLLRYLVEQRGLLAAGGEKTLVVLGLNYRSTHHGRLEGEGPDEYFKRLWTRHGFYTITNEGVIRDSGLNALARRISVERVKIWGLMKELVNLAYVPFKSPRVHNARVYNQGWTEAMGPRWRELIEAEVTALADTIDYLQERKARVVVVRMPMGTWDDGQPFEPVYIKQVRAVCQSKGVKIYDFSKLIDDVDFADSDHLTPFGVEKFDRAVMEFCFDHLRQTGILTASSKSNVP
jgi:hypothetical protein